MPIDTTSDLVATLRQVPLLSPEQLAEAAGSLPSSPASTLDARALARELLRRGWLTAYQANQLLLGHGIDLVLGPYILLERLGEGGMGAVFKARHLRLGTIVALKRVQRERLTNPEAVRRFEREIQAAARLDHPNIVHALDAGVAGNLHYLAMECLEGSDLSTLVREKGGLPVPLACDCIRQAALGLQHAHERGLVHRDVKPSNLLLTREGTVKVLDLGLARRASLEQDEAPTTTLTEQGVVMGTPDFMAPEQALDSRHVDTRSDVYSLGCTLYYLLAGSVPFPGGTFVEKGLRHQLEEPKPLARYRSDVPVGVQAILRRLMAKSPEQRYSTPGEAAAALAVLAEGGNPEPATSLDASPLETSPTPDRADRIPLPVPPSPTQGVAASFALTTSLAEPIIVRSPTHDRRSGGLVIGLVVASCLAAVAALAWWSRPQLPSPQPPASAKRPVVAEPVVETAFDDWLATTAQLPARYQLVVVEKKLRERNPGFIANLEPTIRDDVVVGVTFVADNITDLFPLRALTRLESLQATASKAGASALTDLSPLRGLALKALSVSGTGVRDLSPLLGMPLTSLRIESTQVTDLSPLRRSALTFLVVTSTPVEDLSPLGGMPLRHLECSSTRISSLEPLRNMRLQVLELNHTRVDSLAALSGMPLERLQCYRAPVSDLAALKKMPLQHLNISGTGVSDLAPLANLTTLRSLSCSYTLVGDLTPLAGLSSLETLQFQNRQASLAPLANLPLRRLWFDFRQEKDAEVARGMRTLVMINDVPVAEFWKQAGAKRAP